MSTTLIIVGVILVALGVGGYFFNKRQKVKTEEMFAQIFMHSRQVPLKKKHSFILLMFKESLASAKSKNKQADMSAKFSNPKALEAQLVQMSKHMKNRDQVTDKTMKRSLSMLDAYIKWEKEQKNKTA